MKICFIGRNSQEIEKIGNRPPPKDKDLNGFYARFLLAREKISNIINDCKRFASVTNQNSQLPWYD